MYKSTTARIVGVSALLAVATISSALAGEAPAVSGFNGNAAIIGTYNDDDRQSSEYGALLLGSATAPLSQEFGFQADAALGTHDGSAVTGIGGHLFWRDPSTGLVGLTTSYLKINNSGPDHNVSRFGGEGEYYAGPFTLALTSGYQNGSNVDNGFYGSATGYWYPDENMRLGIGATNDPEVETAGVLSAEYQPDAMSMPGMSLFADASAGGNHDATSANVGVRFYFNSSGKSLKSRNREDGALGNLPGNSINSALMN
jgi:hypothetical protein